MKVDSAAPGRARAEARQEEPPVRTGRRIDHVIGGHVLAFVLRLWFRLYARWEVIGSENVPRTGPLIIAANHASNLDPLMGWAAMYGVRRMWGIAKSELWDNPASAYVMGCIGTIPVRRGMADRTMLRRALGLLSIGEAIGIFPEGTRSEDGTLNAAQPGIAMLIQKSGAAVVPVAILGTHKMLPRGGKKLNRVPLKLIYGVPLTFAPSAGREEVAGAVMAAIAELLTAHGQPAAPPAPGQKPRREYPEE